MNDQRLSDALGKKNAVLALLALKDADRGLGATELTEVIGGYAGSGIQIARHLERYRLVMVNEKNGFAGRPAYDIKLTKGGQRVAKALAQIVDLLP